jgi:hypothetical protein
MDTEAAGVHSAVPRAPPPPRSSGRGRRSSSPAPRQRHRSSTSTAAAAPLVTEPARSGAAARLPHARIRTSVRPSRWDRDVGSPAASGGVGLHPRRHVASGNPDSSGLLHHPTSPDLFCHSPDSSSSSDVGHASPLHAPLLGRLPTPGSPTRLYYPAWTGSGASASS